MFNLIRNALMKLSGKIVDESSIKNLIKEIQKELIIADVNIEIVKEISKKIEERALKEKIPGVPAHQNLSRIVYEELVKIMGEGEKIELKKQKILFCGLFGSGKTTTIGKVARYFMKRGLGVSAICADVSRPAAYEQLEQIAKKVGFEFYGAKNKEAWEIVKEGLSKVKGDVILIDTSGRNALDKELIEELKKVNEVAKPDKKILVVSADIGQVAKKQAEEFNKAIGINGVIITKMDGSGKGGGALSSCAVTGAKIIFIGTGEKFDDLEEFDPKKYVGKMLGIPDFETLIRKFEEIKKEENIEIKEELDIENFYNLIKTTRKMGPLKSIIQNMGIYNLPKEVLEEGEENLKKYEYIIQSMTKEERKNPELVIKNKSRLSRISKGCGVKEEEIKKLINNFIRMKKFYDKFKKDRSLQKFMSKFFGG